MNSNINDHKPYLYLNKVGNNFELVIGVKIQSGETLSTNIRVTPSGGLVTVVCEIINQTGAPGGYKSSPIITISDADTRNNPTLRVEMMKNNQLEGAQELDFTESDQAGSVNGDPVPMVRLEDLGNDRYRPSVLILPEGWVLIQQTHSQTTADAIVEYGARINATGNNPMNMEDLTVNHIEFTDPTDPHEESPGWAGATVEYNGGGRRKAKIPIRNAVTP